jgi:hypothetical protein
MVVFDAPFVESQHEGADQFMRGGRERVAFGFAEAFVASRDVGECEQSRHGFGGLQVGVEQWTPRGGPQLRRLFEPHSSHKTSPLRSSTAKDGGVAFGLVEQFSRHVIVVRH